ncbi:MAG: FGGY-family carbohydrate kinase [Eubacteriales bacterium]
MSRRSFSRSVSTAASLGFFNLNSLQFDENAIKQAGLDFSLFPQVTGEFEIVGQYDNQIPVSVAIGDNQASFLGSVCDMDNCLLVNVGTGSQISYLTNKTSTVKGLEIRPCFSDKFICVGSSLCGGRAFALLEEFLRSTANFVAGEKHKNAYPAIDDYLANSQQPENPLIISTRFGGTRDNPEERGSIKNLGIDNFTPQHLIWGVLDGIVEELQAMYKAAGEQNHKLLIASGNGLRKNKALQKLFADNFGIELKIPSHSEEAAFGAALFGITAAGFAESIYSAQKIIKYR